MKVHLVKKRTLEEFIQFYPASRAAVEDWATKIKFADWHKPADILETFCFVDMLGKGSNRVIFNISGNRFRMICRYNFGAKQVHLFVCWLGTHAEYDKICGSNDQYTINMF